MQPEPPQLDVGTLDGGLYLHVLGAATQRACPTAMRLVDGFLAAHSPPITVTVDLAGCDWVDSTFAGCLVGLRKRLGGAGAVRLSRCNEACRQSLQRMKLDKLVRFADVAPPADLRRLTCLSGDQPTPEELRLMLHAHQELAKLGDENARVFGPIVSMLQRQLA